MWWGEEPQGVMCEAVGVKLKTQRDMERQHQLRKAAGNGKERGLEHCKPLEIPITSSCLRCWT